MRKNNIKKSIKKVSKVAQKNPNAAIVVTATTSAFAIFGVVEAGLIVKNKAKEKIAEIKTKKEKKEEEKKKEEEETTTEATTEKSTEATENEG